MKNPTSFLNPTRYNLFVLFVFTLFICFQNTAKSQPVLTYTQIIQGMTIPVGLKNAGDGTGRLFIVEQGGIIKILKNGSLVSKPFLDFSSIMGVEDFQGIWSIVFSPNYKTNNTFFLLFTDTAGTTKLMRYQTSTINPDSAIADSGVMLFFLIEKTTGGPHFGEMHFGKDGFLYLNLSDGSGPTKTSTFAQDGKVLMGKLLRIDVSNINTPPYYTIPPDNPFIINPNIRDEIWSIGFRNGWRWSFDRLTGDLWIADVGADRWEEVNFRTQAQSRGSNFGFPCYEANAPFVTTKCKGINKYVFPSFSYPHDSSFGGETIIGGYVYRGSAYPLLQGYYICSDYASANAWKIKSNGSGGWNAYLQSDIPANIVSYGEDESGELYAVSLDGIIYKVGASSSAISPQVSSTSSGADIVGITNNKINIYPTFVNNSTVTLELKDTYRDVSLFDMQGHKVMSQSLTGHSRSSRV